MRPQAAPFQWVDFIEAPPQPIVLDEARIRQQIQIIADRHAANEVHAILHDDDDLPF